MDSRNNYHAVLLRGDASDQQGSSVQHENFHYVNKFCGAYATAERQISSGESDTDVLKRAHDIFYADHEPSSASSMRCVLRYEQKWLSLNTPKASSKRKNGETTAETPTTENGDHETRLKVSRPLNRKGTLLKGSLLLSIPPLENEEGGFGHEGETV
ncbi:hypothetical protein Bca52824_014351 [Brassica carinata]|uniref:Uncharacterized protein n=1 Tax=Brassica carinata TaxID=52824 RepID=A0A8X7VZQ4_BRACI|nr:hypothetical protein Bca52824_014351 [Brassica carinata]